MKALFIALALCLLAPAQGVMEADPGLPTHTIYRPEKIKGKLPIVVWGNGACANIGNRFQYFLTEIAAHGYLAIAIGPIGPPEAARPPQPTTANAPRPPAGPPATKASQLIDAIDWAIAENTRAGGKYKGKLDTKKIAVMGQSCGGVQAIKASADPRVTMTIAWNSGVLPTPTPAMENVSKDDLKKLHAPIAWINGDPSDIAHKNAEDDFNRTDHIPALFAWRKGIGHSGTYREPKGGEFGQIAVAYLNWRLKNDKRAAKMFTGPDCGLCRDDNWKIFKKRIE